MIQITTSDRRFHRRLRACRIAAGYDSIATFAKDLGFDEGTYRSLESGAGKMDMNDMVTVARLGGKSVHWLTTGRNDQPTD